MPGKLIPGEKRTMAYKKEGPFKMKGHNLPGINQRSDATSTNVAEEGLAGSSAFQKNSPTKIYSKPKGKRTVY